MALLKKCCCCVDLKTGVKIIGILSLMGNLIIVLTTMISMGNEDEFNEVEFIKMSFATCEFFLSCFFLNEIFNSEKRTVTFIFVAVNTFGQIGFTIFIVAISIMISPLQSINLIQPFIVFYFIFVIISFMKQEETYVMLMNRVSDMRETSEAKRVSDMSETNELSV